MGRNGVDRVCWRTGSGAEVAGTRHCVFLQRRGEKASVEIGLTQESEETFTVLTLVPIGQALFEPLARSEYSTATSIHEASCPRYYHLVAFVLFRRGHEENFDAFMM